MERYNAREISRNDLERSNPVKKNYFSNALYDILNEMLNTTLTIVEAPAGYGKTTAVKEALSNLPEEQVYWYTAIEGVQDYSFNWFLKKIEMVDKEVYTKLKNYESLNRSNAGHIAELLTQMECKKEIYLVIDNFQYIVHDWQPEILLALAGRKTDGLHLILITQYLGRLRSVLNQSEMICRIQSWHLLLDEEDIRAYAKQMNLSLSQEDVKIISQDTHGWAVAVFLCLHNMKKKKEMENKDLGDIDTLLYEHFWKRFKNEQKEILLQLCPINCMTSEEAKEFISEHVKEDIRERFSSLALFLKSLPLIEYDELKDTFYPHSILRAFLKKQLDLSKSDFRKKAYQASGVWYQNQNRMKDAVQCFYHIRDYKGVLSCDLTAMLMEVFEGVTYRDLAVDVAENCQDDDIRKYPVSALKICYALYANTQFDLFGQMIERVKKIILEKNDNQLMGEWWLMNAFSFFPDLEKMEMCYVKASELMSKPSIIFYNREPFMFGCTSMYFLFYNERGKMEETGEQLKKAMEVYNKVTNGHGNGAAELYQGEIAHNFGDFDKSDILAYKAAFLAQSTQNLTIIYAVALLLGYNEIFASDTEKLKSALEYLERKAQMYPYLQDTMLNKCMVETVRTYLYALAMDLDNSSKRNWEDAERISDTTFTTFILKMACIADLLLRHEYKRAIADMEATLLYDQRLVGIPTRNVIYVGLALCYLSIGNKEKAIENVDIALSNAELEGSMAVLAGYRRYLVSLFDEPRLMEKHEKTIKTVMEMPIRYKSIDEKQIFYLLEPEEDFLDVLTARELEVAKLVARGMHNREISRVLHISEETVKSHLKIIFQKLNIDRRAKLAELLK